MSTATAAAAATPSFSPGSDSGLLAPTVDKLLTRTQSPWRLTPTGEGLERPFKFKTFAKTWDFMTAVSLQCKLKNHHPEWTNVYNTTFIRWTTHSPKGLSEKDVSMASVCDELAAAFGEVPTEEGDGGASCELVGRVVGAAGEDCCAPKKK
ncbi:related to pterin-4-alpha-carbinolamine dehydratase [Cephalotrichum gorgonifer]|uniref:4a-hydroxytetrahydrobiopterin dehydratase n=1 Tax=Cephalotrichum gorgonifer TaxID=2041049 RepID=A0AAE8N409_9PEZI|nr:related to pterin-4-alpha-carbinolamine dehydratase [Cephalotrichum gorgonifer]